MIDPTHYIPKPCHQDWNNMTGDSKRRHCDECSTSVHNLSGMNDEEIRALYQENGGKLCGAFHISRSLARPLALGAGIASLALASCNNSESEHLLGKLSPLTENADTGNPNPFPNEAQKEKVEPKPDEPQLAGIICIPPKPEE